jgi:RNA polymerase sigma factor (TIGR02999 family)
MGARDMAEITELLHAVREGESLASQQLFEHVYADLKRMARSRLQHNAVAAEVDTTSLVHDSLIRLMERGEIQVSDRRAFFGYIGRVMRSVLIDHVRELRAQKRGGGAQRVTLVDGIEGDRVDDEQLLALNSALEVLERIAPEFHELVELRYFAGLSVEAIAELRGQSSRTVAREWLKAKSFLKRLIQEGETRPS